jgi:hypothetical protein
MKNKKQKSAKKRQQQIRKRRTAVCYDGDKRTVTRHNSMKGYDVEVIRDFLGQLLLELRVQHYENLNLLRALEDIEDPVEAMEATPTSPKLLEQLGEYMAKYETTLLFADAMDGRNATREELRAAQTASLEMQAKLRDEQIGHMEALQELFDEAILCARTPFEVYADGSEDRPMKFWPVREMIDSCIETPQCDKLLAENEGHPFTTREFVERVKAADVITITDESFCGARLLSGEAQVEAVSKGGIAGSFRRLQLKISSPKELELLVAVVAKYKWRSDYDENANYDV